MQKPPYESSNPSPWEQQEKMKRTTTDACWGGWAQDNGRPLCWLHEELGSWTAWVREGGEFEFPESGKNGRGARWWDVWGKGPGRGYFLSAGVAERTLNPSQRWCLKLVAAWGTMWTLQGTPEPFVNSSWLTDQCPGCMSFRVESRKGLSFSPGSEKRDGKGRTKGWRRRRQETGHIRAHLFPPMPFLGLKGSTPTWLWLPLGGQWVWGGDRDFHGSSMFLILELFQRIFL